MALIFKKKAAAPTQPATPAKKTAAAAPKGVKTTASSQVNETLANVKKPNWFKKGDAVKAAMEEEEKKVEKKREEMGKLWRFYMKAGETRRITFVDGNLTPSGLLSVFAYREHQLNIGGNWKNWFPCTSEQEPCPICESGDEPALVGVLTIIDHSEYKGKKGTYKDSPRLFVAKRATLKTLQSLAVISKGLAGCTFDVTRSDDNAANVGNEFNFIEKTDVKVLQKQYLKKNEKTKKTETVFKVADYENEITYHTAKELRAMGFGAKSAIGGEGSVTDADLGEVDEQLG